MHDDERKLDRRTSSICLSAESVKRNPSTAKEHFVMRRCAGRVSDRAFSIARIMMAPRFA
jgi:hypothetical protein